jgi:hypothetical protein
MKHHSNRIRAGLALLTARISPRLLVAGRSLSSTSSPFGSTTARGDSACRTSPTVANGQRQLPLQQLTLFLAGITADEYLTRVRNPKPQALGHRLKSVTARADPLGRRVDVELVWDQRPPALRDAAITAGFPLTPEVMVLQPTRL